MLLSDARDGVQVPLEGVRFNNCIITGRHADEFVVSLPDSVKELDKYSVTNSLVSTTDTLDTHFRDVVFDRPGKNEGGAYNFVHASRDGLRPVFGLDRQSRARGIADTTAVAWPLDLHGTARPQRGADAGCYQCAAQ